MNVNPIYNKNETINIEDYIVKCGVLNSKEWLNRQTLEPSENYFNIDEWCEKLRRCLSSTDKIYLLVDT